MKTIGERIRKLREEKGIDQTELAEISGIKNETISRIELNKTKPKIEYLEKISTIFNVSIDYIVLGTEVKKISTEENEFLKLIKTDTTIKEALESILNAKKKAVNNFNQIAHG